MGLTMKADFFNGHRCVRCGKNFTPKQIISLICAACLFFSVATKEAAFGAAADQDTPINSPSSQAVNFIFSSSGTVGTSMISPGDHMIDFANISKMAYSVHVPGVRISSWSLRSAQ